MIRSSSGRRCLRPSWVHAALLLALAAPASGAEAPMALRVTPPELALERRSAPDAERVPEVLRLVPAWVAESALLAELAAQPVVPGIPYRNGFARSGPASRVEVAAGEPLAAGTAVGALVEASPAGAVWQGRFVVEDAHAFRVRLDDVELPDGARLWIHGGGATLGPYGRELLDPEGGMWLPPAPGAEAVVEIELPAEGGSAVSALAFTLGEVMELVPDPQEGTIDPQHWTDCDVDATCISTATLPAIDVLREAIARLSFVVGHSAFLCTGGLLNDSDPGDFRPFLLTANHCFSTQASAASLIAYFDYRSGTCNGAAPTLGSVPNVAGATLLATSATSDFTFVELSANPGGGTVGYLGWTTVDPTAGTPMYRVSHPAGSKQSYTVTSYVGAAGIVCGGVPVSDFHYSDGVTGSTTGGSSGAPVIDADGRVLGQLLGACEFPGADDCDYADYSTIDGAFSTTFATIGSWLTATGCDPDSFEPDDSTASPIASGVAQVHSICPVGDEDWVTFTLAASSAVTLETSGVGGDTVMELYDAVDVFPIASDDDGGDGLFSRIDRSCGVDPLPAGTYFVKVEEFGDDGTIADYQLAYDATACGGGACPESLTLADTTVTGTQDYRAADTITLGPALVVAGTDVTVFAGQQVVITAGTTISGPFTAKTGPGSCTL